MSRIVDLGLVSKVEGFLRLRVWVLQAEVFEFEVQDLGFEVKM